MTSRACALIFLWVGLVTFAGGCGKREAGKSTARKQEPVRTVKVAPAVMRPMARTIGITGTLRAQEQSILSAKVAGRLQELRVDVGSVVQHGHLLAQIESRDYELNLQQAAAALAQARTALGLAPEGDDDRIELERVSAVRQAKAVLEEATSNRERVLSLSQAGIASKSELDTVQAAYKVAVSRFDTAQEDARVRVAAVAQRRAQLESARKQLEDASLRAPFDGVIQARSAHVGEYVAPGTPLVELVKVDPLRLTLQIPERECMLVRTGQLVQLFVERDTNAYSGRIARLSPALDEQTRMLVVEADVPARGSLRPGLFARANILVEDAEQGLSVPAEALVTFAGIEKVLVVQDGKALEKVVVTGRRGADWAEILSGTSAGEKVILNPGGLRTGQRVSPGALSGSERPADKELSAKAS